MNHNVRLIQDYLKDHKPCYGAPFIHSMLEFLWVEYGEYNLPENDKIRQNYDIIGEYLQALPLTDSDRLYEAMCMVLSETERLAFVEGARAGMHLALELKVAE